MDYQQSFYSPQQQMYTGGYQRPPQAPQVSPPIQTPGYACKPVTSREEAVAASTDYFSPGVLMPDLAHGMVYLKRFNQQTGASDFFEFKIYTPEPPAPVEYATKADLDALRAELTAKRTIKRKVENDDE